MDFDYTLGTRDWGLGTNDGVVLMIEINSNYGRLP